MKILAVFPELVNRGGAERGLAILAEHFKMDILTNRYNPEKTFDEFKKINVIQWNLPNKTAFGLKLAATKFSGYDLFLDYGYFVTNFIALKNHPTVWYCHSPKRDFYEPFRSFNLVQIKNPLKKFMRLASVEASMRIDKYLVKKIDVIACNSKNIHNRIKEIYGRDAIVAFSPVDVKSFYYSKSSSYYLCSGRIDHVKRIDIVIRAFNKMPGKKLAVAGSADDKKYLEYLKRISGKNIEFFLDVTESELRHLYSKCIATICIPLMEDFGLVPVESMASGKPCIGANEGGLLETIVNGKTGFLIRPREGDLINAIMKLDKKMAEKMRVACQRRAEIFSKEKFICRMENIFQETVNNRDA